MASPIMYKKLTAVLTSSLAVGMWVFSHSKGGRYLNTIVVLKNVYL